MQLPPKRGSNVYSVGVARNRLYRQFGPSAKFNKSFSGSIETIENVSVEVKPLSFKTSLSEKMLPGNGSLHLGGI